MSSYSLFTWDDTNERITQEPDSSTLTIDFDVVRIGASNLPISENSSQVAFGNNPVVDVTSLELGATGLKISESNSNLTVNSVKIVDVATPAASGDLANKDYTDSVGEGLDYKSASKAVADTALPTVVASGSGEGKILTAQSNGVLTVDGVNTWTDIDNDLAVNDPSPATGTPASRVLIAGQASAVDNGLYAVQDKGDGSNPFILVRASDFDSNDNVTPGAFCFITEGTVYAHTGWVLSSNTVDVDSDPLVFDQFTGEETLVGGDGIDVSGTVISVDLATNSGLEINSDELQVDLAAAGSGVGGLVLTGNEIEVISGPGTALAASGLIVNSHTDADSAPYANAMDTTANGIRVRVDASSIEGSLQGSAGAEDLRVKDAGIGANHLNTSVAGDGLSGGGGAALAVNAGAGLEIDSGNLQMTWTQALTNNEGSTVTANQIVYIDSDGDFKLPVAITYNLDKFELGIAAESITDQTSGAVYLREGAVVTGFSGLTPGKKQYVSLSTPGALTESLSGAGHFDHIYSVGRAKSATEVIYNPRYEFLWGGPITRSTNYTRQNLFGGITDITMAHQDGEEYIFLDYGLITNNGSNYEMDRTGRNEISNYDDYTIWYNTSASPDRVITYRSGSSSQDDEVISMRVAKAWSVADGGSMAGPVDLLSTDATQLTSQVFRGKYVPWGDRQVFVRGTGYLDITPDPGNFDLDSFGADKLNQDWSFGFTLEDDWLLGGDLPQLLTPKESADGAYYLCTGGYWIGTTYYGAVAYGDDTSGPFSSTIYLDAPSGGKLADAGDVVVVTYDSSTQQHTMYIDGTEVMSGTTTFSTYMSTSTTTFPTLSFGKPDINSNYPWNDDEGDPCAPNFGVQDLFIANGTAFSAAQVTEISAHGDDMSSSDNYGSMQVYIQMGLVLTLPIKGDVTLTRQSV